MSMTTVSEAIRSRRSVRKFKAGVEIPPEHITTILEAAMMAPSACNTRPWEFIVVKDKQTREKMVEVSPFARPIQSASLAIVICGRPDLQSDATCSGFWPQDCGAAAQNILLQAWELGYGTCWCGVYPMDYRVAGQQRLLGVTSVPVALIAVGIPDETPTARGYYDPNRVRIIG